MRRLALTLTAASAALMLCAAKAPDPATEMGGLARRATLGVATGPAPAVEGQAAPSGALILKVMPGSNAERLGVKAGDLVQTLNGAPVSGSADLVAEAGRLTGGAAVKLTLTRGGKRMSLSGRAAPLALETYEGASVAYDAAPFRGGLLREIIVTPSHAAAGQPVVYYIQGYPCSSVEAPDLLNTYHGVVQGLVARGITVYRVEKPGAGDSRGGANCQTSNFDVEVEAFDAGYSSLISRHGVDPDRIFMLGHSMGGLEAPLLAAKRPPRGVAVYGTGVGNWYDYVIAICKWQAFEARGDDPVESVALAEVGRAALESYYLGGQSPQALAAAHPEQGEALHMLFGWSGGDQFQERHYSYWQQLPSLPLVAAWRDTRSNVLSLYGATDTTALTGEDQRRIADIVNHYRPGTAVYHEVEGTSHLMELVGDRETARRREAEARAAHRAPEPTPFNPKVPAMIADWVEASMAKPPVRLTAPPPAAS